MCHVEQRASRVALHAHVLGLGQPGQGDERTRLGNLGLVII